MSQSNEKKRLEELKKRNQEIYRHSGGFSPLDIIQSGKAIKYSSKRELKGYIGIIVAIVLLMVLALILVFTLFKVKNVIITDQEEFSDEEVISASGIYEGQNIIFTSKDAITKNIASKISYADNIKVKKVFPSTIKISLSKGKGKYYTSVGEYYYVLSEDCVVIDKTKDIENIEISGCIRLQSSKISKCIMGEKISYRDMDLQGVFEEVVMLLEKHSLIGFCNDIILDSKFDIKFTYKERYTVKLGDLYDLEIKFQFLDKIAETLSENTSGIINVSDKDLHEAIVTLYE